MFKVTWEPLTEREFTNKVQSELNALIEKRFSEDKTLRDNLSHIVVRSLDFGTTPPSIRIVNVCEAPDEEQFETRRKKLLDEQKLQRDLENTRETVILPGLLGATNDFGPSATFKRLLQHREDDSDSDRFSVISGGSFMAAALQQQLTGTPIIPPSPLSVTSSKRRITSAPKSPMSETPLVSLEKPLLPTHICSIGTVYKKKKELDGRTTQTKRRAEWWKSRIENVHETSITHALNTAVNIPDKYLKPPTNAKKPVLADLPYVLGDGVMLTVHIAYSGNAHIQIETEVLVNLPVPMFITFPIDVTLKHLHIDAKLSIIYRTSSSEVVAYCEPEGDGPVLLKDLVMEIEMGSPLFYTPKENDKMYTDRGKIETLIKDAVQFFAKEHVVYPNVIKHTVKLPDL
jgi:hypothetical protein